MSAGHETRRTGNERTGGRAASVVERVVTATFDELSRVGYTAMRVEDIAARSGVNKTTIYRRWPTKAELLRSAVIESAKKRQPSIDTGTLRGDLAASLLTAFDLKPYEQGILRVIQMERSAEEVEAFALRMRDEMRASRVDMVHRGIARGELPAGADVELVVDLLSAPVQRALLFNERIDRATVDRMLDLVLAGAAAVAAHGGATKAKRKPAKRKRPITNRSVTAARRAKKP
jgi:AcrR family transcriptional regulator